MWLLACRISIHRTNCVSLTSCCINCLLIDRCTILHLLYALGCVHSFNSHSQALWGRSGSEHDEMISRVEIPSKSIEDTLKRPHIWEHVSYRDSYVRQLYLPRYSHLARAMAFDMSNVGVYEDAGPGYSSHRPAVAVPPKNNPCKCDAQVYPVRPCVRTCVGQTVGNGQWRGSGKARACTAMPLDWSLGLQPAY